MKVLIPFFSSVPVLRLLTNQYKQALLVCTVLLFSFACSAQLEISDIKLCARFTDMPLSANGESFIVNDFDYPLYLTLRQNPMGSFLQDGTTYTMEESLNFSHQGEYVFDILDSLGVNYGNWKVESYATANVSAGSSSSEICANDTVPLVGSLPYDNRGNLFSYYFVEWSQVDNLPTVNWVTSAETQIARVTNFQTPGTYNFEYTLNPGTDCSTSDVMTVTVEDCEVVSSNSETNDEALAILTITNGQLTVINNYPYDINLTVFDLSGKPLLNKKVGIGENFYPAQHLVAALYAYSLTTNRGQILTSGKVLVD